jgi:hypothetical protein
MKTITEDTRYAEIEVGDLMPTGEKIVAIERKPAGDGLFDTRLTVESFTRPARLDVAGNEVEGGAYSAMIPTTADHPEARRHETTFGGYWDHLTLGDARRHAEYMHSLPDHS